MLQTHEYPQAGDTVVVVRSQSKEWCGRQGTVLEVQNESQWKVQFEDGTVSVFPVASIRRVAEAPRQHNSPTFAFTFWGIKHTCSV